LKGLVTKLNVKEHTSYTLQQLDPKGLNLGTDAPAVNDLTPQSVPLLSATTFVVGDIEGTYARFACVEMDDAAIDQVCSAATPAVPFGSIRNISDAAQNGTLPPTIQSAGGGLVYDAYGFYTSYNGALAAWAIISA
jgi:hypothetical protein